MVEAYYIGILLLLYAAILLTTREAFALHKRTFVALVSVVTIAFTIFISTAVRNFYLILAVAFAGLLSLLVFRWRNRPWNEIYDFARRWPSTFSVVIAGAAPESQGTVASLPAVFAALGKKKLAEMFVVDAHGVLMEQLRLCSRIDPYFASGALSLYRAREDTIALAAATMAGWVNKRLTNATLVLITSCAVALMLFVVLLIAGLSYGLVTP